MVVVCEQDKLKVVLSQITKLRNLSGIYNIDVRRLKGSLWDFKTVSRKGFLFVCSWH
jgi:hypothetical protein